MINFDVLKKAARINVTYTVDEINSEYVKEFRRKYALTQIALANIMGVTKKTIEKWEQGINKVSGSSSVLFTLLSKNENLLHQIRKVELIAEDGTAQDFKVVAKDCYTMPTYNLDLDIKVNHPNEGYLSTKSNNYIFTSKKAIVEYV